MTPNYVDMYGEVSCPTCDNIFTPRATTDGVALDDQCPACSGEIDEEPMSEEMDTDVCPECGAPAGIPHSEGCPNAEELGPDPDAAWDSRVDRQVESNSFDKFVDRILIEEARRGLPVLNDSPQRARAARNQERPLGRIRFRKI